MDFFEIEVAGAKFKRAQFADTPEEESKFRAAQEGAREGRGFWSPKPFERAIHYLSDKTREQVDEDIIEGFKVLAAIATARTAESLANRPPQQPPARPHTDVVFGEEGGSLL